MMETDYIFIDLCYIALAYSIRKSKSGWWNYRIYRIVIIDKMAIEMQRKWLV